MKARSLLIVLGVILFSTGCELTITNNPVEEEDPGTLAVFITDAPFPFDIVEEASITISRVEIRTESDSTDDKQLTIFDDTASFNLMELRNGVTELLLETELPPGNYNTMRLYVSSAEMILTDQRFFEIDVPSGEQTGIKVKINPDIEVITGLGSTILLDFDLSKSFVLNGNTNIPDKIVGVKFKPVVRAVNYSTAATVAGTVVDPEKNVLENMEVWIEDDSLVATTYTNAEGIYGMLGIPAGTFSMYATGEGYDTAVHELVELTESIRIIRNFTLNPVE